MISKAKIDSVVNKIIENFNPNKIILIGSYAAGNATEDSDLDLLVIKETEQPRRERNIEIRRNLIGSMIPMDILVYTPSEFEKEKEISFSFVSTAIENSKVLYEKQ